ncbi:MAG: hypothetical protein AAGA60_20490 [Cyanobacteria bacterium P01_E01_bin.42]
MSFQEMEQKYKGQWLLIAYTDLDEEMQVKQGKILAHSQDKEQIYQALESVKYIPVAIEFVGEFVEEMDYILLNDVVDRFYGALADDRILVKKSDELEEV